MTGRFRMLATAAALAALAVAPACSKKPGGGGAAPAVAGLAAVPADAEAVFSFDVPRLIDSQLIQRTVDVVLARSDGLRTQWTALAAACGIDVKTQVRRVLIALGPVSKTGQPALMVVSGDVPESKLSTCVQKAYGTGSGAVSSKITGGRTLYTVTQGNRSMWFGYGQADTVVLGPNQAWVEAALGKGPKVTDSGALKALIARADQAAPIWAAGHMLPAVTEGLMKPTGGALKKGPESVFVSVDPTSGLRVELGADMASEDDAKTLEQFATDQLRLLAQLAQWADLGPAVAKVRTKRDGANVTFALSLSMDEVNQLMTTIDSAPEDPQPSAPTVDAAPGSVDAQPQKPQK